MFRAIGSLRSATTPPQIHEGKYVSSQPLKKPPKKFSISKYSKNKKKSLRMAYMASKSYSKIYDSKQIDRSHISVKGKIEIH